MGSTHAGPGAARVSVGAVLTLVLAVMTSEAFATAGFQEAWSYRNFWVIKPYAMSWSKKDPNDATLYVGYDGGWIAALLEPGGIWSAPGTFEHRIPRVKAYSTAKWLIYGSTWDGTWFLVKVGTDRLERYADVESWEKAVADEGGPAQPALGSIEDSYWASMRSLWFWRVVKAVALFAVCSIPWLCILPFLKRRWLRRGIAAQAGRASAPVASSS